jgi:hypothetical protein
LNSLLVQIEDIGIDFDKQWERFDSDNNGWIDIKEAVYFLDEIKMLV